MKIRKHKGINQQTGKLKKGYKYSGKRLKNGLPQIIKVVKKQKGGIKEYNLNESKKSLLTFEKIDRSNKEHKEFVKSKAPESFCSMSGVLPGSPTSNFFKYPGYVAKVGDKYVGFMLFSFKKRRKLFGGDYVYLEMICATKNKIDRQGYKVGSKLLEKLEEIAKQMGYKKLRGESVAQATKFYKKMGWKVEVDGKMKKKLG